jgi:hypothetical protein
MAKSEYARPSTDGRKLIRRLIWIEAACFGLILLFISIEHEYLIPKLVSGDTPYSPQTIAEVLDSLWVVLLFVLALSIQRKILNRIRILEGMISVCANCKRIRDDENVWQPIEEYIHKHSHADFSHSICPDCGVKLYGDLYLKANGGSKGSGDAGRK